MEDENDEGHFDEAGNFIWDKAEKSVQEEAWLDTVSEDQIEAAKSAKVRGRAQKVSPRGAEIRLIRL
jgi:hypothetical protein